MPTVSNRYAGSRDARGMGQRPDRSAGQGSAPVVLMVSGGADSTALLVLATSAALDIDDGRGLARIGRERLHVLHVNHQLRGLDAEEDEEFVRDLASEYGLPCTVRRVDVLGAAESPDGASNVEEVGRDLRYAEAARLANRLSEEFGTPRSAARILTAHTADDRAETFLMNALRGAGASGLSSIPRRRNRIVRPLLDRTHEELCNLLRMRGIIWREDATNTDTTYLRAFVRHEVLPTLRRRNPRVVSSLATACDILSDEDSYLSGLAMRSYRDLVRRREDGLVALDAARLAACEVVLARRMVRRALAEVSPEARLEARHVAAILEMVARGGGSVTVALGIDVRVEFGMVIFRDKAQAEKGIAAWLDVPGVVEGFSVPDLRFVASSPAVRPPRRPVGKLEVAGGRTLYARMTRLPRGADAPQIARDHGREWEGASVLLDAVACGLDQATGGRLWVDVPQPGDVMCPLGMHGQSKKVSDLLGEARVPVDDRARAPIVRTSANGPIVWLVGIRADERARCTAETRLMVELMLVSRDDVLP